jgi:hypothetical protein
MLMGPEHYEEKHEKWMEEVERKKRVGEDERLREFLVGELERVEGRLREEEKLRGEVEG